ncbi:hypothetical protein RWE15_11805 [Virgibacillus halophilus]|uniref:Mandelate racemase / muconate lactonizing enzyme, N-terminal domain n=1 Tax=Tigheibacillus halophilus TaxID=361280 RepID=A0ABU5C7E8_9BACI|nr:hypothetical protein [Virgibacillus halophilus]
MKITKIDINYIELPLKEPFIISYASYDTMPAVITKVYTDVGIIGFGESIPDEHVTGGVGTQCVCRFEAPVDSGNYGKGSAQYPRYS